MYSALVTTIILYLPDYSDQAAAYISEGFSSDAKVAFIL